MKIRPTFGKRTSPDLLEDTAAARCNRVDAVGVATRRGCTMRGPRGCCGAFVSLSGPVLARLSADIRSKMTTTGSKEWINAKSIQSNTQVLERMLWPIVTLIHPSSAGSDVGLLDLEDIRGNDECYC
ncbi:hypothetical protein TcWFU_005760 [Taenia crassiceps]|uniref:Uncharacterized protein n=1 Tax=Taenia crassiceps TaxID=6207 RepID=A0ABR4Q8B0_9CEST